ncbi:MAG: STAS domain-containing protein [Acidimicrobiia bacterium]|jgi:anti-anti-sigma factor
MTTPDDLVEVRLIGVPIEVWRRASAHQEAIQREFDIIRAGEAEESVPNRLRSLIDDLDGLFGGVSESTWAELHEAADRGDAAVDLVFRVPVAAGLAARQLADMLDEVDEFCRAGEHLVSLATPPELLAFRNWFLGEFTNQAGEGLRPVPWEAHDDGRAATGLPVEPPPDTSGIARVAFAGPLDLATAEQLRESIQEKLDPSVSQLVVDLSNIGFVDSIGISLLVSVHNRLVEQGASMRLIAPRRLQDLLELSGLTEILRPEEPLAASDPAASAP